MQFYFRTGTTIAGVLLLTLADAIPYEKPYNIARFRLFPGIHKFLSIKSGVNKLDTAQKVYSVNKGLFLGMLSLPWFPYMGRYGDSRSIVLE